MRHFRVCSLRPCYQRLWLDMRLGFCVLGRVAETALNMVVDKPGCLEKRITDRRTEKPESPPFHVPGYQHGGRYDIYFCYGIGYRHGNVQLPV